MIRFGSIIALALLAALASGAIARADCTYKPFDFHPEKNDGVVVDSIVNGGSSCTHNFAEGPGYKFTDITFEREPENGKLVRAGATRFIYTPNKGLQRQGRLSLQDLRHQGRADGLLDGGVCGGGEVVVRLLVTRMVTGSRQCRHAKTAKRTVFRAGPGALRRMSS
jgi:hypothetical protein